MSACYVLPTCLQDDVLCGGVIVAAFLHIASMPGPSRGFIEWGYGPECQVHLVLVETRHFCEVVHVGIIILRRQIVQFAIHVTTAAQQGNLPSACAGLVLTTKCLLLLLSLCS